MIPVLQAPAVLLSLLTASCLILPARTSSLQLNYHCSHVDRSMCCFLPATPLFKCSALPAQGLYYLLGTRPNPLLGMLDFFALGPLNKALDRKLSARDFVLRDK
jgi:hypothetical protein